MFAILFQSLIGTIKTAETIEPAETAEPVSIPHRYDKNSFVTRKTPAYFLFQSLIGTIKTKSIATIGSRIEQFQSLIGTIKTERIANNGTIRGGVSIPHRYDKNSQTIRITTSFSL